MVVRTKGISCPERDDEIGARFAGPNIGEIKTIRIVFEFDDAGIYAGGARMGMILLVFEHGICKDGIRFRVVHIAVHVVPVAVVVMGWAVESGGKPAGKSFSNDVVEDTSN